MAKQPIPVRLPDELEDDLRAFSEAHYDAPLNRIIGDALREFMERRLAAEPEMRKRFDKCRLGSKPETRLRVVNAEAGRLDG